MNPDWDERGTTLYWLIIAGSVIAIAMIIFGYQGAVGELPAEYRKAMHIFVAPCLGYVIYILISRDLIWLIEHQNQRSKELAMQQHPPGLDPDDQSGHVKFDPLNWNNDQ